MKYDITCKNRTKREIEPEIKHFFFKCESNKENINISRNALQETPRICVSLTQENNKKKE